VELAVSLRDAAVEGGGRAEPVALGARRVVEGLQRVQVTHPQALQRGQARVGVRVTWGRVRARARARARVRARARARARARVRARARARVRARVRVRVRATATARACGSPWASPAARRSHSSARSVSGMKSLSCLGDAGRCGGDMGEMWGRYGGDNVSGMKSLSCLVRVRARVRVSQGLS